MTTIAVDETTHQMLAQLKQAWGARSYDELLRRLLGQVTTVPESMFGAWPKLKPLTRGERSKMVRERV